MSRQKKVSSRSLASDNQIRFEDMSDMQRDILFYQLLNETSESGGYKYKKTMHRLTAFLFAALFFIAVFTLAYAVNKQSCFSYMGMGSIAALFAISFWILKVQKQYSVFLSRHAHTSKG